MKATATIVLIVAISGIATSGSAASFDFYFPGAASNVLGLAVNPVNGNVFMTSNSYGGQDNLVEFSPTGTLLRSTRAAIDTGVAGNLGSLAFGSNGNLYVSVSRGSYDPTGPTWAYSHSIVEMSQDGSTVYSSLQMEDLFDGSVDAASDTTADRLITVGRVGSETVIKELGLGGEVYGSSPVYNGYNSDGFDTAVAYFYSGAFDRSSGKFYALRRLSGRIAPDDPYQTRLILEEYAKDAEFSYLRTNAYSLDSILASFTDTPLTLAINDATGLFYMGSNENLREFLLSDLSSCYPDCPLPEVEPPPPSTVPLPAAAWLLLSGLAGLGVLGRRRKH